MKLLLLSILWVLARADQYYGPAHALGTSIPPQLDAYGLRLVSNAQHNPNTTRLVTFKPFLAATKASSILSLGDVGDIEWAWRQYITFVKT
jgi:hypothetical protein